MTRVDPDRLQILDLAYHRNGVAGLPFAVALVDDANEGDVKLVIMFAASGHTAVLSFDKLHQDEDISFGSNSYRGDEYERALREEMWDQQEEVRSRSNSDDDENLI